MNVKSNSYALIVDEKTNLMLTVLMNLSRQVVNHAIVLEALAKYGVTKEQYMAFLKETADREHELGWCKDPNCLSNGKQGV